MNTQLMYLGAGAGLLVAALYYARVISTLLGGGSRDAAERADERAAERLEKHERRRDEERDP
jgi:hypothetical protein